MRKTCVTHLVVGLLEADLTVDGVVAGDTDLELTFLTVEFLSSVLLEDSVDVTAM